jgi:hypothetical protein
MNRKIPRDVRLFREQLDAAKRALFSANSVQQVRFLQHKINYLRQRVKELEREGEE